MTADLIAEGRKMLDGVTPGPWAMETVRTSCGVCHKIGPWPHKWRHGNDMSACIYDDYPSPAEGTDNMLANSRFIAWSRDAVPGLLAALEASQARAEALEAEVARLTAQAREDAMQLLATSGQAQDALVEVAALRAEVARLKSDRIFILGANHGYDTAMDQVSEEARRYASFYSEGSDGRNTFTLFAEWVDGTSLNGEKT